MSAIELDVPEAKRIALPDPLTGFPAINDRLRPGYVPPWPDGVPRNWRPLARVKLPQRSSRERIDDFFLAQARRLRAEKNNVRQSATTGTWAEMLFRSYVDYTANNTTSVETSLLAGGNNRQPVIPALFFKDPPNRCISIMGRGVLSTFTSGTLTFLIRIGTTQGSASLAGVIVGTSAALTMTASQTNVWWEFRYDLVCTSYGEGGNNATLQGSGYILSPKAIASPFFAALEPTTPDTATWTQTIDGAVTNWINISSTWSVSNVANSQQIKAPLMVWGWN